MFSSELTDFTFKASGETEFGFLCGEDILLHETYVPDADGMIKIRDLDELLEPYLIKNLMEECSYYISDGYDAKAGKIKVQYCKAEIGMDAGQFLKTHFLTRLMGDKVTAMNRREYLHLICTENTPVTAHIRYKENGVVKEQTKTLLTISVLNSVQTIDVSPSVINEPEKEFLGYTIKAGERKQTYLINRTSPRTEPDIIFTNSFGCQEIIYCQGTFQLEAEYERSQAIIDGKFKNYLIDENRKYKANTGVLTTDMANWMEDMFRSTEVYLFDGGAIGKEITLTDSKCIRSNDPDELPSFNFEYRYSQKNHNIMYMRKAGRIFDETFDRTFN